VCVCYFVLMTRYCGGTTKEQDHSVCVLLCFVDPVCWKANCVCVLLCFVYVIPWGSVTLFLLCVLLCFIKPILGNRYGPGIIP